MNKQQPITRGYFGEYGGRFVAETLQAPISELEQAYREAKRDPAFQTELKSLLRDYVGRPTPLYQARSLSPGGGARIYLKREDLCHTGAHKINNCLGQALLARRMGKKRVIAETGAGQHGVATATACALLGLECEVYMGEIDTKRQALNVFRMELLGARVIPVTCGSRTLKDACNEAMRDWVTTVRNTYYLLGSVVGPAPYPEMVRDFQAVIGKETKKQFRRIAGKLPDLLVACVGGGSNAMGFFFPFLNDPVRLIGVEAGGRSRRAGAHCAALLRGRPGVLHGSRSYLLQDRNGQIQDTHSVSAGLDYPGVGPEHSFLKDSGRATYLSASDQEALKATVTLSRKEGIIPALESAHAVAGAIKLAKKLPATQNIVVCLSGRGDKDLEILRENKVL